MNSKALLALERMELIMSADSVRQPADPFKLPANLSTLTSTRRTNSAARIAAASLTEGDRAAASLMCRTCFTRLERYHRIGCRFLDGLLPDFVPDNATGTGPHISDTVRLQLKEAYGFEGDVVGTFTDERTENMALQAVAAANLPVANSLWHYPQDLRDAIAAEHALLQAHQPLATGGSRQVATAALTIATAEAEDIIARVRGFYISASDLGDRTQELAKIGLQPRRLSGEASSGLLPDQPGFAVHDAVAKTLTIPVLPGNCSSIRAYRQIPGGARELAGVSLTPVVSLIMAGPLEPGTVYEAWVVGVLGDREGPESNRVSFTAA